MQPPNMMDYMRLAALVDVAGRITISDKGHVMMRIAAVRKEPISTIAKLFNGEAWSSPGGYYYWETGTRNGLLPLLKSLQWYVSIMKPQVDLAIEFIEEKIAIQRRALTQEEREKRRYMIATIRILNRNAGLENS